MFRTVSLSIIRSLALYTLLASSQHNLYVLLCVQSYNPDDGQRNSPKHVESYSRSNFEKLVHLVGFIIRLKFLCRGTDA